MYSLLFGYLTFNCPSNVAAATSPTPTTTARARKRAEPRPGGVPNTAAPLRNESSRAGQPGAEHVAAPLPNPGRTEAEEEERRTVLQGQKYPQEVHKIAVA